MENTKSSMTKIVFFGTPAFAVPFLTELSDDPDIEVVAVVCQPDKPKGRGAKLQPPEVKVSAESLGLKVNQPKSLKSEKIVSDLKNLDADLFVVVAYGKIIPQGVLDIPPKGTLNVHPSLLPKYRGPSPMQWVIASGDKKTGVSIMLLDAGMDTGPILEQEEIKIDDRETYESLTRKVHEIGPELLARTLKAHVKGEITSSPQKDEDASLTSLITREDGHIDWTQSATSIDRLVRAYNPWPGTWTIWKRNDDSLRLKIIEAEPIDASVDANHGRVVVEDDQLKVSCGEQVLRILEVQLEGKAKMKAGAFIRGYKDIDGALLS